MYFQHSVKSQFLTGHKPPRKPNFKSKKGAETTLEIKNNTSPPRPEAKQWPGVSWKVPQPMASRWNLLQNRKHLLNLGWNWGGLLHGGCLPRSFFIFYQGCYPGKRMSGTIPTSRGRCKHTMKRKMTFYATIWFKSVHSTGYLCKIFIKHNSSKLSFTFLSSALLLSTSLFKKKQHNNKY